MKKHLKVLASALTLMLVASAMIGCGKKTEEQKPTSGTSSTTKVPSGQKITVWSHLEADFPELKNQVETWAKNTGNTVTVVKDNNKMEQLLVAAKSPTGPDIMWGLPSDHLGQFVKGGILDEMPATAIQTDEYVSPEMLNAGKMDGKQYALPVFAETYAIFYNKDKVKEFPKTWEDMVKAGKLQWDLTNFYFTYGVLASTGNYVFKENNGSFDAKDLGLNKSVDGYKLLQQLVTDKHVDKSVTGDVAKNNFKAGKIEFYLSGPWDVADFQKANVNFDVAPIPTINGKPGKSFMGVQLGYLIKKASRTADQKAAIADLLKFLSSKDSLQAVGKAGSRLPVKKDIAVEGVSKGFSDQLANAELMPNIAEMQSVWDPAKAGFTLLLSGEKDAQGTMDYVQAEVAKKVAGTK